MSCLSIVPYCAAVSRFAWLGQRRNLLFPYFFSCWFPHLNSFCPAWTTMQVICPAGLSPPSPIFFAFFLLCTRSLKLPLIEPHHSHFPSLSCRVVLPRWAGGTKCMLIGLIPPPISNFASTSNPFHYFSLFLVSTRLPLKTGTKLPRFC